MGLSRHCNAVLVALAIIFGLASSGSAATMIANGHWDIAVHYENGELGIHLHNHDSGEEYDPSEAFFRGDPSIIAQARSDFGPNYNLFGVGDPIYLFPNVSDYNLITQDNTPFIGWSTEELPSGIFQGNIRFELVGFSGPDNGNYSAYSQIGPNPTFRIATFNGIGATDVISIGLGTHAHFNQVFTQIGVYDLTFRAVGSLLGSGAQVSSRDTTIRFVIGDFQAVVPEPSTLAMTCLGAIGAFSWVFGKRKTRRVGEKA